MVSSNENNARRQVIETAENTSAPRICMPTFRNFARAAFRCGLYEAQDVLAEIDDVDLIRLDAAPGLARKESWLKQAAYHDPSRQFMFLNPGLKRIRLNREYDLFVAVCQYYHDILYINALDGWKDRCKTSVCWIDELWAWALPRYKYWLHALSRFDHIFVGCLGTVAPLSRALGRPVHWFPGAADTIRFSPHPNPPGRVIDVYSIGRRWNGIHRSLLQAASRREIFYLHDTFAGADALTYDHRQHRDLLANVAKRSRFFVVAPARMDSPEYTQGQPEIGFRYYEGATAGAVMIGQQPKTEAFQEMFPWPDAVVEIQPDGSDVLEVLAALNSEPERVSAMSQRNVQEALLRHDWAYRWKKMLSVAGIQPTPRMAARERRLKELADLTTAPLENIAIRRRPL